MWVECRTNLLSCELSIAWIGYRVDLLSCGSTITWTISYHVTIRCHVDYQRLHGLLASQRVQQECQQECHQEHQQERKQDHYSVDFLSHGLAIMLIHSNTQHQQATWNEGVLQNAAFRAPALSYDHFILFLSRQVSNCSLGCIDCVNSLPVECFVNATCA